MPATDHAAVRHDLRPAITAMMRDAAVPGLSIAVVRDDRLQGRGARLGTAALERLVA